MGFLSMDYLGDSMTASGRYTYQFHLPTTDNPIPLPDIWGVAVIEPNTFEELEALGIEYDGSMVVMFNFTNEERAQEITNFEETTRYELDPSVSTQFQGYVNFMLNGNTWLSMDGSYGIVLNLDHALMYTDARLDLGGDFAPIFEISQQSLYYVDSDGIAGSIWANRDHG